jgi:antitoxin YefM
VRESRPPIPDRSRATELPGVALRRSITATDLEDVADEVCEPGWQLRQHLVILVTMSESLSLAETKAHLSELVSRVHSQHDRVTVTVHGRPSAVLLSLDDLDALEETIAILSDEAAVRQLAASDAELARGEGESEDQLSEAIRARRHAG